MYQVHCTSWFYLSFLNSAFKYWLEPNIKKHLKGEGGGLTACMAPGRHTKSVWKWCKALCSCYYLWLTLSHLASNSKVGYFSSVLGTFLQVFDLVPNYLMNFGQYFSNWQLFCRYLSLNHPREAMPTYIFMLGCPTVTAIKYLAWWCRCHAPRWTHLYYQ